jgi:hypothetical protein
MQPAAHTQTINQLLHRHKYKLVIMAIFVIALHVTFFALPVSAASAGCTALNGAPYNTAAPNWQYYVSGSFNAGEVISWDMYSGSADGQPSQVLVEVNLGTTNRLVNTWADVVHETGSYTIPTTGGYTVNIYSHDGSAWTATGVATVSGTVSCSAPPPDNDSDTYPVTTDCDDSNAAVNPGATELDNGIDDNCNSQTDEGFDTDSDGYTPVNGNDCNDGNAAINPAATEVFDGADNNCNGQIDETFADADGDGYPVPGTDCNDANAAVHPGATEIPGNGIDDDCDGTSLAAPVVTVVTVQPQAIIVDGRENLRDLASPVVIYMVGEGVHVYWWDEASRTSELVVEASAEEVAAVGIPAGENTLIETSVDGSVRLYRLPTGEFQVNVDAHNINDFYIFIWNAAN